MATDHRLPDLIRVLAPSGVAALNILGRTIHSALGLPIDSEFVELRGSRLARFQQTWSGVHFITIDEKSMLGLRTLAQIDARLQQMKPDHSPLGGFNDALVGGFAEDLL